MDGFQDFGSRALLENVALGTEAYCLMEEDIFLVVDFRTK
jgi:hypothetical protein